MPGRTFFTHLKKTTYCCSGPLSIDPTCLQPRDARSRAGGVSGGREDGRDPRRELGARTTLSLRVRAAGCFDSRAALQVYTFGDNRYGQLGRTTCAKAPAWGRGVTRARQWRCRRSDVVVLMRLESGLLWNKSTASIALCLNLSSALLSRLLCSFL